MIKTGDRVYYRYRVGMFHRTFSETVLQIENRIATVKPPFGNARRLDIGVLNKKK